MNVIRIDYHERPKKIILDTGPILANFDEWKSKQSFIHETTAKDHAAGMFSYIVDSQNARENICGYLTDIEEENEGKLSDKELFDLLCVLEEMARDIWVQLTLWNVFSASGLNWYNYDGFAGDGMVISLLDKEAVDCIE